MIVIEELDTAVVELDAAHRIRHANPAAEECLAASRDRLLGQQLPKLEGVSDALTSALDHTGQDERPRRLHDCPLPGGRYDCTIRQLDPDRFLLECHSLDWNQHQRQLQQFEVQTGLMDELHTARGTKIVQPSKSISTEMQFKDP